MTEPDASLNREEERLMKAMSSGIKAAGSAKRPPATASVGNGWQISLKNLPTSEGNPVELLVANKSFFTSAADGQPVDTQVVVPFQGFGNTNEITVKIPENEFVAQQKFQLSAGAFILFEATDEGLRVAQQQSAF